MKSFFLISLESLENQARQKPLKLKEVFEIIGERSHLVFILLLSLPFMQPIPLPGLSTVFGLMMIIVAIYNYLGKPVFLPARYKDKTISQPLLLSTLRVAETIWQFLEKFIRVRGSIFFKTQFFRGFNTLVLCVQAFLLCLPLPIPFSNNIPALVIIVNVIGELEEDGLVVFLSYLLCAASLTFFWGVGLGVKSGWDLIQLQYL